MPKVFTSKSQRIGEIGESVACIYLTNHGYRVIGRNYTRKWGEIDIIAEKDEKENVVLTMIPIDQRRICIL